MRFKTRTWFGETSMRGVAAMKLVLGLGALGLLAGAGVIAFVLLSGGDSDEEAVRAPTASATAAPSEESDQALAETYRMIIERIGVDAPVATYGLDEDRIPSVPTGADAAEVIAWYDFSARPGTDGNAVFAGHVTWNGEAVFYNLQTLQSGDIIRLRDDRGTEVVYRVTSNYSVDPNDPEAVKTIHPTEEDVLTIVTCGGTYFETSDPVLGGDYTQRIIIRAELVA